MADCERLENNLQVIQPGGPGRMTPDRLDASFAALADEAFDRLAAQAARSPGAVDLLVPFARPFPLAVICEMLSPPPEDRPKFTRWASRFSTSTSVLGILWGLLKGVN